MSTPRRKKNVLDASPVNASLRPVLLLLTGASGSGRTTFYESYLKNTLPRLLKSSASPLEQAQKEQECGLLMKAGESFVYSSTIFDLEPIRHARSAGYDVKAIYVATEDPDLNLGRVLIRVGHGGPFAPVGRIRDDSVQGLKQLAAVKKLADDLMLYDNTAHARSVRLVAHFHEGELVKLTRSIPKWAHGVFGKKFDSWSRR
jgi:predicted ABC-type ATPase